MQALEWTPASASTDRGVLLATLDLRHDIEVDGLEVLARIEP